MDGSLASPLLDTLCFNVLFSISEHKATLLFSNVNMHIFCWNFIQCELGMQLSDYEENVHLGPFKE